MSEEAIATEEGKLNELAAFLKENAIPALIQNLQKNEGIPTDSQSLGEFFHHNGVNIRYLGYIADQIKDKDLT